VHSPKYMCVSERFAQFNSHFVAVHVPKVGTCGQRRSYIAIDVVQGSLQWDLSGQLSQIKRIFFPNQEVRNQDITPVKVVCYVFQLLATWHVQMAEK
jgi:hypothetical protein